jgi:hypothetical protein
MVFRRARNTLRMAGRSIANMHRQPRRGLARNQSSGSGTAVTLALPLD